MKKTTILFILLLSCFPMPSFAQQVCTEIGCMDGLTLRVDPNHDWKSGNYDLYFKLGGRGVICRGRLPLKPCEEGPTFQCGSDITVGESGCALPQNAHAIADIHIDGNPSNVSLEIVHNGRTIITRRLVPDYQLSRPNGPGCGPVCRSAVYDLFNVSDPQ